MAGGIALGIGTAIEACNSQDNNTPDSTANVLKTEAPLPSQTAMATEVIESPTPTIAPTPEPTPTPKPPYGPPPPFDALYQSINIALDPYRGQQLPGPVQTIDWLMKNLYWCNEEGEFDVIPDAYPTAVINSCLEAAQGLTPLYARDKTPELKIAIENLRDFTIGKIDQFLLEGRPLTTDPTEYKRIILTYFHTED